MILNSERWHYTAVKELYHYQEKLMVIFIIWIAFIQLEQQTNLNPIKKYAKNKNFCGALMLLEDTKILEFNQYQKPD